MNEAFWFLCGFTTGVFVVFFGIRMIMPMAFRYVEKRVEEEELKRKNIIERF